MAYVDDKNVVIYLPDALFFLQEFHRRAAPKGMHLNTSKTRILTSTNGTSALPAIARRYGPRLAAEIKAAISLFSNKPAPTKANPHATIPVEVTTGLRVLGQPVGSKQFAEDFFHAAMNKVEEQLHNRHQNITDKATLMRLFNTCAMHKTPHLLGSEVLYFADDHVPDGWDAWNGPLAQRINSMAERFLSRITNMLELPPTSMLLAYITLAQGGLGMMDPHTRAIPDFVITMSSAIRAATHGFYMGADRPPIPLPASLASHFDPSHNPSDILLRYHRLVPTIASIAAPKSANPIAQCPVHPVYQLQERSRPSPPTCQRKPPTIAPTPSPSRPPSSPL